MDTQKIVSIAADVYGVVQPLLWPVAVVIGGLAVKEMRRRGFQTTYVEALGRAVGAGVLAAKDAGLDPLSKAGRVLVVAGGVKYIENSANVSAAGAKLGLTTPEQHAEKVGAQLGVIVTNADAQAAAVASTAPAALVSDVVIPLTAEEMKARLAKFAAGGVQ